MLYCNNSHKRPVSNQSLAYEFHKYEFYLADIDMYFNF